MPELWTGFSARSIYTMSLLGSTCWIGGSVIFSVSSIAPFFPKILSALYISSLLYVMIRGRFLLVYIQLWCLWCQPKSKQIKFRGLTYERVKKYGWFYLPSFHHFQPFLCVGVMLHLCFPKFCQTLWWSCWCGSFFTTDLDMCLSCARGNIWTFICRSSLELVTFREFYCFINSSLYTWWLWLWLGTSHTHLVKPLYQTFSTIS